MGVHEARFEVRLIRRMVADVMVGEEEKEMC